MTLSAGAIGKQVDVAAATEALHSSKVAGSLRMTAGTGCAAEGTGETRRGTSRTYLNPSINITRVAVALPRGGVEQAVIGQAAGGAIGGCTEVALLTGVMAGLADEEGIVIFPNPAGADTPRKGAVTERGAGETVGGKGAIACFTGGVTGRA